MRRADGFLIVYRRAIIVLKVIALAYGIKDSIRLTAAARTAPPSELTMNHSTSLYLDIFRAFAALIVLLSHVSMQGLTNGQMGFMYGAGVQAVDAFFVLSGFVIAHVSETKENDARTYFISRAARIYSVAIPAIALTALMDAIGIRLDPSVYVGPYQSFTPGLLVRSVAFIGEQWNTHRFPGSNGPYWSLGFEVWYYIAFGIYLFAPRQYRWPALLAVLAFIGPKVALMFPTWLMGVGIYRFCQRRVLPKATGWLMFSLSFLLLAAYQLIPHSPLFAVTALSLSSDRLMGTAQDYFLAVVFSINIVGFITISDTFAPLLKPCAKAIRWLAGSTFTVYLMHLPIMHLLATLSPWPQASPWRLVLLLAATPLACLAFAEAFERRKNTWRKLFLFIPTINDLRCRLSDTSR
jgi:peptidoglycan/LPS O-acetylase OafA/YrhL